MYFNDLHKCLYSVRLFYTCVHPGFLPETCIFHFATHHVIINTVESAINPFVINEQGEQQRKAQGKSVSVTGM